MGEKQSRGVLYACNENGEMEIVNVIEDAIEETFDEGSLYPLMCIKRLSEASAEFSCSLNMATDSFTRFVHAVLGIKEDLYSNCPNNRVVHLARYAKKPRVKKKNYNRMIKLAEKEKRQ